MRILEVCGSASGGVRAHLGQCSALLSAQGHDVIVEAPAAVLEGLDIGDARAEMLTISHRPSPSDSLAIARLARLGKGADVIHAHGLRAGALAALALGRRRSGRTRLVVTEHNRPVGSRAVTVVGSMLARLVAARADAVLAVSPDLGQSARELGTPCVELAVIPAPSRSSGTQGAEASCCVDNQPWPEASARILTVARLAPQKGLDLLIDAARILRDDAATPPFVWAVAGDGPLRESLEAVAQAHTLPVRFLGRRDDAAQLMRQADVLVQTSLWEGQPLTIQEALRAQAAIVATDVGGTAHTARGGATLVPPRAKDIAAAIKELLTDPQAAAQARTRAAQAATQLPGTEELAEQLTRILLPQAAQ